MDIIIGILIPFVGTVLGATMVYFMKNKLNKNFERVILGFAAGVMVAASIWSLLIPSMESVEKNVWIPASVGLIIGVMIFFILDLILKKKKIINSDKVNNLMLAITIHNIPEGMAVGVAFASYLLGKVGLASCFALAIGIGIQNFPEGTIVSLPLYKKGYSKNKAFMYGVVSALFELIGAIITLIFTNVITIILPYLLALAAGAMFYVVVVELIPESDNDSHYNVVGFLLGFLIMMILDVTLG